MGSGQIIHCGNFAEERISLCSQKSGHTGACAGGAGAFITTAIHFAGFFGFLRGWVISFLVAGRQVRSRSLDGGFCCFVLHVMQAQMRTCRYAGEHKGKNDKLAKKTFDSAHT